jgi:hypothetical protein
MSTSTTQTLKDKWIIHADTHGLPLESIPTGLRTGQSGASFGWPNMMVGDETLEKLHGKRITRTSMCIQLANCMTEDQFQEMMGGSRPSWAYLVRCMENQKNIEDYRSRHSCWDADQCIINNRILTEWLLPQLSPADVIHVNGREVSQLTVVKAAIAENDARLRKIDAKK